MTNFDLSNIPLPVVRSDFVFSYRELGKVGKIQGEEDEKEIKEWAEKIEREVLGEHADIPIVVGG